MLETLIEYQIASGLYKELLGAHGEILRMLNSRKGDIDLMGQKRRIEQDLNNLTKVIMNYRPLILAHYETKHSFKFAWLSDVGTKVKKVITEDLGNMKVST